MSDEKGFSIVELMVAMIVGLILMGGVIQVITMSQGNYKDLVQQARMQESAKFALDFMVRDLRNVGYWGCSGKDIKVANVIEKTDDEYFNFDDLLVGYQQKDYTLNRVPNEYNSDSTNDGDDPIEFSDVIEIRLADVDNSMKIEGHNPASANIELTEEIDSYKGTTWAIVEKDCTNIGIFAQTGGKCDPSDSSCSGGGSNYSIIKVQHNQGQGAGLPANNCTKKELKGTGDCSNTSGLVSEAYSKGSSVFKITKIAYYLEPSSADSSKMSLHRRETLTSTNSAELIDGITALTFEFGLDTDDDGTVDLIATAKEVHDKAYLNFNQALSVRISLTVSAPDANAGFSDQVFTTTVGLRNRGF